MSYVDLHIRMRWSTSPPCSVERTLEVSSVDSAMLVVGVQGARNFRESIPVGDGTWYNMWARCKIREPAPPSYASHEFSKGLECVPQPMALQTPVDSVANGASAASLLCSTMAQTYDSTQTTRTSEVSHHCGGCTNAEEVWRPAGAAHSDVVQQEDREEEDTDENDVGVLCRFGSPCGRRLMDTTLEGTQRHLLQYHWQDLHIRDGELDSEESSDASGYSSDATME